MYDSNQYWNSKAILHHATSNLEWGRAKEIRSISTRFVGPITLYTEGSLTPEILDSSFDFSQKVRALSNQDALKITMNWLKRGVEYNEPYDRFIASWISFNALYSFYYKGSANHPDSQKMKF